MNENVVTAIFEVESEAYQAFANLRKKTADEGYVVAEAALVKRTGDDVDIIDCFDATGVTVNDTATGMMVGAFVGILGGPLGVMLGASFGALTGSLLDSGDALDSASALEVTARKLFDNEAAIIALVQEDEPAFDAAFEGYKATVIRHFAVDVYDEVDRARELEAELINTARAQLRADLKTARQEYREERRAEIAARFEEIKQQEMDEALKLANDEVGSSTEA